MDIEPEAVVTNIRATDRVTPLSLILLLALARHYMARFTIVRDSDKP